MSNAGGMIFGRNPFLSPVLPQIGPLTCMTPKFLGDLLVSSPQTFQYFIPCSPIQGMIGKNQEAVRWLRPRLEVPTLPHLQLVKGRLENRTAGEGGEAAFWGLCKRSASLNACFAIRSPDNVNCLDTPRPAKMRAIKPPAIQHQVHVLFVCAFRRHREQSNAHVSQSLTLVLVGVTS